MSGHNRFESLIENFSSERKVAIEEKKKAMLAEVELREALESTLANWQVDSSTTSIERVDACLDYLRQAVKNLGGELVVTAKFPDGAELSIDSLQSTSK